jgi:hypothetical protein
MKLVCLPDETNSKIHRMYIIRGHVEREIVKDEKQLLRYGLRLKTPAGFSRRVIAVARRYDQATPNDDDRGRMLSLQRAQNAA